MSAGLVLPTRRVLLLRGKGEETEEQREHLRQTFELGSGVGEPRLGGVYCLQRVSSPPTVNLLQINNKRRKV